MKSSGWFLVIVATVALVSFGCSAEGVAPTETETEETTVALVTTLCGNCGQVKGSDACCAEGATLCDACTLVKGAPGCCAMEAGTDVVLCSACGQVKGSETCCAEGAEMCPQCDLVKGSPGCRAAEI